MEIVIGNYKEFYFPIRDADGVVVSDLSTATITWCLKDEPTDTNVNALIDLSEGAQLVVDSPITGTVKVILLDTDTASLTKGWAYQALEIDYGSSVSREVRITEDGNWTDKIEIVQDVKR